MKLTQAQWCSLVDVSEGHGPTAAHYPPAKKLVELGLCQWVQGKFSDKLVLTESGRQFIAEQQGDSA